MRAEVQDVIGGDNITLEHISKLKYLDMVCKETIRLFPIGPLIMRELKDDLNLGECEGRTVLVDCDHIAILRIRNLHCAERLHHHIIPVHDAS